MPPTGRVLHRIARVCEDDRERDAAVLRRRLLDELRRVVRFDWHVWLLTDPVTAVGSAPVAAIPPALLARLPQLIRLKYLTAVNRWTLLATPVASLVGATDGDRARSLVWRELLGDHGVTDVASVRYADRYGTWGFLDLWRTGDAGPFTRDDLGVLAGTVGPVSAALRRCQAATFVPSVAGAGPAAGPVVLLLSSDLRVLGQTPGTPDHLRALVPPTGGEPPIPVGAYNVGAQLLAVEAGVDANPPSARVHLAEGRWLTLRAARIDATGGSDTADIAVSIDETPPGERIDVFARAHGLSDREGEVLRRVAHGGSTREVARSLYLSEHTIQDHLKRVFAKTGTNDRGSLVARALGT